MKGVKPLVERFLVSNGLVGIFLKCVCMPCRYDRWYALGLGYGYVGGNGENKNW